MERIPDTFEELSPSQKEIFAKLGFELFQIRFGKGCVQRQSQEISRVVDAINACCQQTIESQYELNELKIKVK